MKVTEYAYRVLGRHAAAALLGGALFVGAGAVPALAQHTHDHDAEARSSTGDVARDAVVDGYREGFEHGAEDRNRGLNFNYSHDDAYRQAGNYQGRWGSYANARELFRRAYERGYSDGYYRRVFNRRIAEEIRDTAGHDNGYDRPARRLAVGDVARIAQANGYSEGFEHGVVDRANRSGFSYQHDSEYRLATSGYRSEWGLRTQYQLAFRQSYARGYQDAFYGRAYNRSFDRTRVYQQYGYDPFYGYPGYRTAPARIGMSVLGQRAAQQGWEDGYLRGQYDRSINVHRPNPQGHGAYEYALNGWNPEWGGASTYQQYYRRYFLEGYQQGFAGRGRSGVVFRL